jgi:SAM-dependent methyltransferase
MKTKEIDFSKLYDEGITEYVQRRNPDSYSARRIALEVHEFKIPNLISVLPKDFEYDSVVEIGCATGELIANFPGARIKRRMGFDLSSMNIDAATARFPNTTFHVGDFRSFPEQFDIVILSDILEHVSDDLHFLKDAANLGGLLLINLPLEKCLTNLFRKYGPSDPSGHLRKYSFFDGMRLIEESGLDIIDFQRKWVMESIYELCRQQLNKEMFGVEFGGSTHVRLAKHSVLRFCKFFKTAGRLIFPSNLFISAKKRNDF